MAEVTVGIETDKVLKFQKLCNTLGIRDYEGKALIEDNELGPRTKSCTGKMPVQVVGSTGPAVKFIQETLGTVPVDGVFCPITRRCVMEYQSTKNIEVDGIVGIHTWTAIVTT